MTDFKFEVGCRVKYHPVIGGEDDGCTYEVVAKLVLPQKISRKKTINMPVYELNGKSGCVSQDALTLAE